MGKWIDRKLRKADKIADEIGRDKLKASLKALAKRKENNKD